MNRAVTFLICAVLICAAGWCVFIRELAPPSIQAKWIQGLYVRKEAAARLASDRPKVLIIGGSGVHFGYSAEKITKLTGTPTINFGIHAGLGAPYMLNRVKRSLRPGDTAVLALEPALYSPALPSDVLSEYVLHSDWSYLLEAHPATAARIIFGFSPASFLRVIYLHAIPWNSPLARPETASDSTGDETLNVSTLSTQSTRDSLAKTQPIQPKAPDEIPPNLRDFLDWANANSVHVIHAWTPMLSSSAYQHAAHKAYYTAIADWYRSRGAAPLDDSSPYLLSIDDMFDYWLHANERGRDKASTALAERLLSLRPTSARALAR